ncbi:hypothetical protein P4O66_018125, partial [Electrophorus voltai]
ETHVGPSANCPAGSIQIQGLYPDYDWAVFTTFKNTCRGVAVLFREGLGCEGLRVVGDDKGRYLIISCKIQEKEFEFVNVYNPTDELIDFNQFRDDLLSPSEATYFVIGDALASTTPWHSDYSDHTYCVHHCSPVTIFNIDYNILATILAERLNGIMGHVLKPGQTRSLLSVQDYINAFENIKAGQLPVLTISVKVDPSALKWPYLFHRLKTLKLPHRFRSVVRSLLQCAQPPSRGLKVGCPLTPSLISFCLVPLIHSFSLEERLEGVAVGGELVKATLENDRAIVFLSNPNEALHVFEEVLENFMDNSGFAIDNRLSE